MQLNSCIKLLSTLFSTWRSLRFRFPQRREENMDKIFKALADSGRRKLLDRLFSNNGQTLGELCEHLDMSRQAVSKHLKILENANLVVIKWRGREKLHYLNPVPINEIYIRWINKFERHQLKSLDDLKKHLETEDENE